MAKEEENKQETKTEAVAEPSAEKKRRKVARMSLAEVEKELKVVQEKMGSLRSDFARHLLARKKQVSEATK